jgi:glycosyltransferase involved in cell wall biosynthesis
VDYVGPVDDEAKRRLLGRAAALLMPVLWDEPFGIVMAEALACGTPVIGLARGAVPEVVSHGSTGFVCEDTDAMVAAVPRLHALSRAACRHDAETRFSQSALANAYESLFRERVDPTHVNAALESTPHV